MSVTQTCRDVSELSSVTQTAIRLFFQELYKAGIRDVFLSETYRSQARQKYLYAQGRTRPGKVVTWTLNSNHSSRRAWDMAVAPPKSLYDANTLARAGAIARKLGINWGGYWKGTPDRPHFEVPLGWKFPKGYRMEGDVIIPSNSQLRVQLYVKDKGEVIEVSNHWNPGSSALYAAGENKIRNAVKNGWIGKQHLTDIENKTMTTDRMLGLSLVIDERAAGQK